MAHVAACWCLLGAAAVAVLCLDPRVHWGPAHGMFISVPRSDFLATAPRSFVFCVLVFRVVARERVVFVRFDFVSS